MNFQPQPYPLFAATKPHDGEIQVSRVIGWAAPDSNEIEDLKPVVVIERPNGASDLGYLHLDERAYVIDTDFGQARRRARDLPNP
ncbi:hypothetical protein [Paractinoplanes toevensis]|uniref:Uncharacterized protein n=1 Tax=Paractinoplanes toevensis TaxID=571911 RepID=A0A919T6C2_9ACTN|nr:hypothetical protein [Actinoplanes toevensis]GIM89698.1 hypothetical protein Ato02nite_014910 [Actinoplanes toevensis]